MARKDWKGSTLFGNPYFENKRTGRTISIRKDEEGEYTVLIFWDGGIISKSAKTKSVALRKAKSYMRTH